MCNGVTKSTGNLGRQDRPMGIKTFFKGGSSYPGQLALKMDPKILDTLVKDYKVVVVTGTNGKR